MSDTNPTASPTLGDELVSVIRVGVAGAVGFGATQLLRLGVHVDPGLVVGLLTPTISTGYYAVSRYLAKHVPWAERLLLLKNPNS